MSILFIVYNKYKSANNIYLILIHWNGGLDISIRIILSLMERQIFCYFYDIIQEIAKK